MDIFTIIGLFAATFTTVAFMPQAMQVIKTKQTKDLSLPMYIFFTIGVLLWLIYGILILSLPVILANIVTLVLSLIILIMKIKYK